MKKVLKKVLIIFLVILILNNFLISGVRAEDPAEMADPFEEWLSGLIGSVIGLLTYPIRIVALAAGYAMNALTAGVAYIEGTTDGAGSVDMSIITPFDIFFNKVQIVDINFFDIGTEDTIVNKIRTGIASWYYVLRLLATVILLVILIYVGIRMAISTIASDKAMYKKMLFDWIVSLALVFLMHYIIIFTVTVCSSIVNAISLSVNSKLISDTYTVIRDLAFKVLELDSIAATVIYCMLVWQTFGLLISYFNRMLKLAFLVIIAPLITLTYSIDKMGDGKAQAIGSWLKEFVFTILIQPFHCIIYMCFVDVGFKLLTTNGLNGVSKDTIATAVVAILCVKFVKEGENLVRKIFQFQDDNSSTSIGAGAAIAAMAMSKAKGAGSAARSSLNGVRNFKGMAKQAGSSMKALAVGAGITARAVGGRVLHTGNDPDKTIAERKEDIRINRNENQAEKIEEKYNVKATSAEIKSLAAQISKQNPGITTREAMSIARVNLAKKKRAESKGPVKLTRGKTKLGRAVNFVGAPITATIRGAKTATRVATAPIRGARGVIKKGAELYKQSDTLQFITGLGKGVISAGLGTMVGSGIYGTNGNMPTALMSGMAMYKGSQGFFQNTTRTLAGSVADSYAALGAKTKFDVNGLTKEALGLFSDDDEAKRVLDEIMQEIEDALQEAHIEGKYKTQIKNTVQRGIGADASKTDDVIKFALDTVGGKGTPMKGGDGKTLYETNNGAVRNAVQKLADYENLKQIYQKVEAAGELNVDNDTFVEEVMDRFFSDELVTDDRVIEDVVRRNVEKVETKEEFDENRKEIDNYIQSKMKNDENIIEDISAQFDDMIEGATSELTDMRLDAQAKAEVERHIQELKIEQADIIGKALADIGLVERRIKSEIVEEYESKLKTAISQLEIEAKGITDVKEKEIADAKLIRMKNSLGKLTL